MRRPIFPLLVLVLAIPVPARAQLEWATWSIAVANVSTGSFSSGPAVELTSFFDGITGLVTVGGEYTSVPPIPGAPGNGNPSFRRVVSGSPNPSIVAAGALAIKVDLNGLPVDTLTTFGLADLKSGNWYTLSLFDGAMTPLPLTGLKVTHYNLTLTGGVFIADYDVSVNLTNGFTLANPVHDVPGAFYEHSGLALFDHLPPATRFIQVNHWKQQETEGLAFYLARASTTPVEPVSWSRIKALHVP